MGGILAAPLLSLSPAKSLTTLAAATVCASMGLALAFMLLALYLLRLVLHGPPRGPRVGSVYIPLGPLGKGGYDLLLLGTGYNAVLALPGNETVLGAEGVGIVVCVVVLVVALGLWAVGTMWLLYGLLATTGVLWHDHVHFKPAFWSLLYPNVSTQYDSTRLVHYVRTHMHTPESTSLRIRSLEDTFTIM